ncbi:Type II secretion system protein G [Zhongshania aliphaticivorans]|uniref:Type II secretion system protein G n=1 Tax=Zhongshania aliphaticivorans TaxID=1470434 RepID=A0A5S9NJQ0_9GAMM|nr:type II secretion system major pseudopilin GspG [Zhongshania aliphaticivorans]CAA0089112.1 Type II secretion system protein G [Zhongshania aliphaticivorans]CAA0095755.1 Type II secretion system protein G [Zhongshania aliphaticivorans]
MTKQPTVIMYSKLKHGPLYKQQGLKRWEIALILVISMFIALAIGFIVSKRIESAISEQINNDFTRLSNALHQYKLDNKRYPTTTQGLHALLENPTSSPLAPMWKGPYISRETLIQDPWRRAYLYQSSDAPPGFEISTYGGDAEKGGENTNADVVISYQSDENYYD